MHRAVLCRCCGARMVDVSDKRGMALGRWWRLIEEVEARRGGRGNLALGLLTAIACRAKRYISNRKTNE